MGWYMWRFSRIETKLGETLSWNTVIFNSDLFFKGRYGFRKNHSTEMASLALVDIIVSFMDNGDTPIGIFLDSSKAFDTLYHNILLHKLKHYGLSKNSTGLIKKYLENSMQYVNFDNVNSHHQKISTGVPHGSILGPLLFLIYVNDRHNSSKLFQFILFADDTTFLAKKGMNNNLINRELCKISIWFKVNKLSLNVPKSKCILFHQPRNKIIEPEIIITGNNFNFLGLIINKHLNWNDHIDHISLKISRVTGILTRLRHTVPIDVLLLLYNFLLLPHINYSLLVRGHNPFRITKLQKNVAES